jgi:hypothetical protein
MARLNSVTAGSNTAIDNPCEVKASTEWARHSVHQRDGRIAESHPRLHRAEHDGLASSEVLSIVASRPKVSRNQPDGGKRQQVGHRLSPFGNVRFNRVA